MTDTTHTPGDHDASEALADRIRRADAEGTPLRIVGGDTKAFYGRQVQGRPAEGQTLSTAGHRGITYYDPVELIVSVRTGTPLAALEVALADQGQMLGCEPPHFGDAATVGGMVATGLSGPRRPWAGSVRDFVLGTRVINHEGIEQRFGGQVMKNVAGYDLSRLMVGAQGTLGLLTEVTLKVLPRPGATRNLHLDMSLPRALERLAEWGRQPLPITAAACKSRLRSGASRSMRAARMVWTVAGTRSVSTGRVSRYEPGVPASAPVSTRVRTVSSRKNGLPLFTSTRVNGASPGSGPSSAASRSTVLAVGRLASPSWE